MDRDLLELGTVDLAEIDRQIARLEKLQKLRELLSDSDIRELLRRKSSNGHARSLDLQSLPPKPKRGDFGRKVYEVARLLPQPFTVSDVQKELLESGYQFLAAKPEVAVGSAIRKLIKRHRIDLVSKGSGRIANKYAVLEK